MSMHIEYRYTVSKDDARARLRAFGEYLENKHGIGVTWVADDKATVRGKYMVVSIEGEMQLKDGLVVFDGKDPGFLWRGKAKDYLNGKLAKYLDAKTPLDSLPRR